MHYSFGNFNHFFFFSLQSFKPEPEAHPEPHEVSENTEEINDPQQCNSKMSVTLGKEEDHLLAR